MSKRKKKELLGQLKHKLEIWSFILEMEFQRIRLKNVFLNNISREINEACDDFMQVFDIYQDMTRREIKSAIDEIREHGKK